MMKGTMAWAALACAALSLAGCSKGPNEGQMKDALIERMAPARAAYAAGFGDAAAKAEVPDIKRLKKLGCDPEGERTFLCKVEVTTGEGAKERTESAPVRFVQKGDGTWSASM